MGRETVLLVVAVVIATLGASLVHLYVRGVDRRVTRANSCCPASGATTPRSAPSASPTKGSR
ncbi:hypothetical protein BH24ACT12_BH24ACT12_27750 [soil metagenome]|jgi:hypothetical protein